MGLKIKQVLYLICLIMMFFKNIFALDGNVIIINAELYKNHPWKCNEWNARTTNANGRFIDNDPRYPFFPAGEPIGPDPDGPAGPQAAPTATGQYVGVVYGWGKREGI